MPLPDRAVHPVSQIRGSRGHTPIAVRCRFLSTGLQARSLRPQALSFAGLSIKRLDSLRDASRFDLLLIYREMFRSAQRSSRGCSQSAPPPIVFDYDDAIFLHSVSHANRFIRALKTLGRWRRSSVTATT